VSISSEGDYKEVAEVHGGKPCGVGVVIPIEQLLKSIQDLSVSGIRAVYGGFEDGTRDPRTGLACRIQ
jgi:hypothetical protein